MSVYMIIDIKVKNRAIYLQYIAKASRIVKRYGGRYIVKSEKITAISGKWTPERIVVIEFPSQEALKKCFRSEEYKSIAPLRERSTISKSIAVKAIRKP